MIESKFGHRDSKGNYKPNKRISYPPVFVWPVKPLAAIKWLVSIPGYFFPWNSIYVGIGLVVWFFLSPSFEDYATPDFKLILFTFSRNSLLVLLYFGIFHYRLYVQRVQNADFKFNPRWPSKNAKQFMFGNQNIDNIILTFGSGVTIWTIFEIGLLCLAAKNSVNIINVQQDLFYFIAMIFLIHLWRDLHFYLIHRLLHFKPLYSLAHRIHHKNTNPGPWSGLAMHPIEHLFYFSCALLYLFFPFHPAFIIITLVHAGLSPAPGHVGFERIKLADEKSFDADSYAHYLHHKYFECNYADGILPLDRWFGTLHDGSDESQYRLSERLKKRNRRKIHTS